MLKDKNKIKKDSAKLLDSKRSHFEQANETKFNENFPVIKQNIEKPIDPDLKEILDIETKYREGYQNKFKTNDKSSYITYDSYSS
jgi:hypothetical protein